MYFLMPASASVLLQQSRSPFKGRGFYRANYFGEIPSWVYWHPPSTIALCNSRFHNHPFYDSSLQEDS